MRQRRVTFKQALLGSPSFLPFQVFAARMFIPIDEVTEIVGDTFRGYSVVNRKRGLISQPMSLYRAIFLAKQESSKWTESNPSEHMATT